MQPKQFIGPRVRALRQARAMRLEACASALGISASYLSQIEANQRPVTPRVLVAIVELFQVGAEDLHANDDQRLIADLRAALTEGGTSREAVSVGEIRNVVLQAPAVARRFLDLHRANLRLAERLSLTDEALSLDEATAASSLLPYEEVRDFFHDKNNYLDRLDRAAEALAGAIALQAEGTVERQLEAYLAGRFGVVVALEDEGKLVRRYEPAVRRLVLNPRLPTATRVFQMAYQLTALELAELIEAELAAASFRTREAVDVCRIGLGNYAAGALLMPYERFRAAARAERHDVEQLALIFGASLEQVCHRLSTLQRPGANGVPLYFVRMDHAGNITKRHSATRLRFARFGGACPLWNVHDALGGADRFVVQVAEMPDGVRYLCVARSVAKRSESFLQPDRRYVLGFGCEISHAHELVYSTGVDLSGPATRIGVSCRICERNDCGHRAFPPVDRSLRVEPDARATVPYRLD